MVHFVCCVWDSLWWVWGSECVAGGFVVGVCRYYVTAGTGNEITAVLRTIHLCYEGISGYL
jgi:hypothetical protein